MATNSRKRDGKDVDEAYEGDIVTCAVWDDDGSTITTIARRRECRRLPLLVLRVGFINEGNFCTLRHLGVRNGEQKDTTLRRVLYEKPHFPLNRYG
jgi:hypothetical protein